MMSDLYSLYFSYYFCIGLIFIIQYYIISVKYNKVRYSLVNYTEIHISTDWFLNLSAIYEYNK